MSEKASLEPTFGLFTATMIGVGAMIGAGIFVLTGIAAGVAGPALVLVFALNGVIALLTGMVYAELGSAMPEAGGGYLWVKNALPSLNGFLSGWMSWFAHAFAGSLYALGFGAYVGLIAETYHFSLLTGDVLQKTLGVLVVILFMYVNYRGTSEIGTVGNVVTIIKVLILIFFIATGLNAIYQDPTWMTNFDPFFTNGFGAVFAAMGLTFIAFEGYEIIAQSAEELKNPAKNIPRAIFISLGVVVVIYILVAIVSLGVIKDVGMPSWQFLALHEEIGLVEAAKQFMPFGKFLLLFAGIVSTMSALNATIFSSTRVFFAMGRDFNLPKIFGLVSKKTHTPVNSLYVTIALIVFGTIFLPIHHVAAAADVMFLLLFTQVCIAQIILRNRGEVDYPGFKVPFFPYLTYLAIFANIGLALFLSTYSPIAWIVILIWCGFGALMYFGYSESKELVERRRIAIQERPQDFHIVTALDNYDDVSALTMVGSSVAKQTKSDLIGLNLIEIPYDTYVHSGGDQIRGRDIFIERAEKVAKTYKVPIRSKAYVSHAPTKSIIDFTRHTPTNLLLIGWRNNPYNYVVKGEAIQKFLEHCHANVGVIRDHGLKKIKKIIVPIAVGREEHHFRLRVANRIAKSNRASIVLVTVIDPDSDHERVKTAEKMLSAAAKHISVKYEKKVVKEVSHVEYLLRTSGKYDLMILGPSRDWISHSVVLGKRLDKIANHSKCTVMMLKQFEPAAESWIKLLFRNLEDKFLRS